MTTDPMSPALDPEFQEWFRSRPQVIQDMVLTTPPWNLYSLEGDGDHYMILSYNENGTVTATRYSSFDNIPMWNVFGIDPGKLTVAASLV